MCSSDLSDNGNRLGYFFSRTSKNDRIVAVRFGFRAEEKRVSRFIIVRNNTGFLTVTIFVDRFINEIVFRRFVVYNGISRHIENADEIESFAAVIGFSDGNFRRDENTDTRFGALRDRRVEFCACSRFAAERVAEVIKAFHFFGLIVIFEKENLKKPERTDDNRREKQEIKQNVKFQFSEIILFHTSNL